MKTYNTDWDAKKLGDIIDAVRNSSKSIGKPSSYISTCLIGKTKSCNGFIWRYKR